MFHRQEGAGSPSLLGDIFCFTFFTNDQCRMTNDHCLKEPLAAGGRKNNISSNLVALSSILVYNGETRLKPLIIKGFRFFGFQMGNKNCKFCDFLSLSWKAFPGKIFFDHSR